MTDTFADDNGHPAPRDAELWTLVTQLGPVPIRLVPGTEQQAARSLFIGDTVIQLPAEGDQPERFIAPSAMIALVKGALAERKTPGGIVVPRSNLVPV